jgi:hypothetical protein
MNESQDGPPDPASGRKWIERIRRTTSLSMSTPECQGDLLSNSLATPRAVPPFHFDNRIGQLFRRSFGTCPPDSVKTAAGTTSRIFGIVSKLNRNLGAAPHGAPSVTSVELDFDRSLHISTLALVRIGSGAMSSMYL